nr:ARID DNA-binding domain-containing protein [Tanacetum cinerariifolium]
MVNTNTFLEVNWHAKNKCIGQPQQWYQSKNPGKPLRRKVQQAFIQRQIKRENEERIGKFIKQITRDCKDMLRKKLEEIKTLNSSIPQHKYRKYNCFYCKQEGHIIKFCPIKIKDEAKYAQSFSDETASKFTLDKSMILCFKCKGYGHFANKCPSKKQEQPKVSIKYHEFIHFKTRGVLKGMVQCTWDDFWERFNKVLKWFYNHYLKRQLPRPIPQIIHGVEIYLFDLYKLVDCMGGYLSVIFGQEFDVIAEILGLTKGDGEEIKRCYISYLDVFTSYYKTARAPQIDSKSLVSYQWNMDRTCAPKAVQKEKEKLEHFRIKLEDETDCNIQQTTHYEQDKDTICKRPSTSRISNKEGSYGSTNDDYIIIT